MGPVERWDYWTRVFPKGQTWLSRVTRGILVKDGWGSGEAGQAMRFDGGSEGGQCIINVQGLNRKYILYDVRRTENESYLRLLPTRFHLY